MNPEPGWGERKKEAVRKVVNMYVLDCFAGFGDASGANNAEASLASLSVQETI